MYMLLLSVCMAAAAAGLSAAAPERMACEDSGYCSVGMVKTFTGDIGKGTPEQHRQSAKIRSLYFSSCCCYPLDGQLKAALASCGFKKEIILLTATSNVLNNALQLYSSFLKLGLAHSVLLAPDDKVRRAK